MLLVKVPCVVAYLVPGLAAEQLESEVDEEEVVMILAVVRRLAAQRLLQAYLDRAASSEVTR